MHQIHALIVEDQRDNIDLFHDVLQIANCCVDNARDGRVAIEWLKANQPPELIILDMNIPYLSGLEVYRYIREQPRFSVTHIVAVTANIAMAERLEKELVDGDRILHKPVNVMELLKIAKNLTNPISAI